MPPCRANVGDKVMTLIAGGECFDDADALRAGETDQVLGYWVAASSTLGTFLRSFSFGHARQLDVVSGELLECAWSRGAGRGEPLRRCRLHDPRDLRAREAGWLEVHLQLRARLPPLDLDRRRPATSATCALEAARAMPGAERQVSSKRGWRGCDPRARPARSPSGPTPTSTTTRSLPPAARQTSVSLSPSS